MNKILKSILFWTPRALGILFILLAGMFSLDVFGRPGRRNGSKQRKPYD